MFNLRQDLKVYTSAKYQAAKALRDAGAISLDRVGFECRVRISRTTDRYGHEQVQLAVEPQDIDPQQFTLFLRDIGASHLLGLNAYYSWSQWNPTKTYNDFATGTQCRAWLSLKQVERYVEENLPANRMKKLVFDQESSLAGLLGRGSQRWSRSSGKENRMRAIGVAWALYGIEIAATSKNEEVRNATKALAPSDFGITSCDDMQDLLTRVSQTNWNKVESICNTLKAIDEAVAKNGGAPIRRKMPRQNLLRKAYFAHTGETPPVKKPKGEVNVGASFGVLDGEASGILDR